MVSVTIYHGSAGVHDFCPGTLREPDLARRIAPPAHEPLAQTAAGESQSEAARIESGRRPARDGAGPQGRQRSFLEMELESELDDAGIERGTDPAEGAGLDVRRRAAEVRMIESIEQLGAELHSGPLSQRPESEVLDERNVLVDQPIGIQDVGTRVSVRVQWRQLKGRSVEPPVRRALIAGQAPIAQPVRVLGEHGPCIGTVRRHTDAERRAALYGGDAAKLPASQTVADQGILTSQMRHLVIPAERKPVWDIPVGTAVTWIEQCVVLPGAVIVPGCVLGIGIAG